MDLKEKVKNLTTSPGVYFMKDSLGGIIYVGKAKNLKRRLQSYFQSSRHHPPKVENLIKNLKDFDYIITYTEFEAFMLECKMIKKLKPIYNKKMKSPLSYTYVKIKMAAEYPGIEIASNFIEGDGNLYLGPYTSKNTVERAIEGIKECTRIFCSNSNPSRMNTSCLNYSLGLCIGICMGNITPEQYCDKIYKIIDLLKGTDTSILGEMNQKMLNASQKFDFETAAKYRDYITAISFLINKEIVIGFTQENKNIVVIEPLNDKVFKLFLIKGSKLLFTEKYDIKKISYDKLIKEIKENILVYFRNSSLNISSVITRNDIDEAHIIYSYLKGCSCKYIEISEKWLNSGSNADFDEAINKFIDSLHICT